MPYTPMNTFLQRLRIYLCSMHTQRFHFITSQVRQILGFLKYRGRRQNIFILFYNEQQIFILRRVYIELLSLLLKISIVDTIKCCFRMYIWSCEIIACIKS